MIARSSALEALKGVVAEMREKERWFPGFAEP